MAVTFYMVTVWGVGALVVFVLLVMAWIRIESHRERRRLNRMRRESDAKRDASTPRFEIGGDWHNEIE